MNYYGIVNNISSKNGIYGRKEGADILKNNQFNIMNKVKMSAFAASTIPSDIYLKIILSFIPILKMIKIISNIIKKYNDKKSPIIHLASIDTKDNIKYMIISNETLVGNYNIDNEDNLFGLFKSSIQFESIMKSQINSNLIILERDNLPKNIKHYGGEKGIFSYGIYCEHPKNNNILIPINNYNDLIKIIILEESLRVFEALGAKKIYIEDVTDIGFNNKTSAPKANIGIDATYKKEILRKKEFGNGFYNPERAFNEIYFIHDYPNIMTVVNSRINGNQTKEEFTENVNINIGLDIDVIKIFKNELKFNYDRKWHFLVEFYDKKEI